MKPAFLSLQAIGYSSLLIVALSAQAQTTHKSPAPTDKPKCMVAEIRGIAFGTHHPGERYQAVSEWLKKNGPSCSLEKLQYINGNRPNWFGHADSPALGQIMDQYIEIATGMPPKQPITSPEKERTSLVARAGGADAPAPVVQGAATQPAVVVAPVVAMPGSPAAGKGPGKP